jgi:hypothetical protein
MSFQGKERYGMSWHVKERQGMVRKYITCNGKSWHGKERYGKVRHGMEWKCKERHEN